LRDHTYIYALCGLDGIPRYVGKSDDPHARFQAHLRDSRRSHKVSWIKSLREGGLRPVLVFLEVVSPDSWEDRERCWIEGLVAEGLDIVNATPGGEGMYVGFKHTSEARAKIGAASSRRSSRPAATAEKTRMARLLKRRTVSEFLGVYKFVIRSSGTVRWNAEISFKGKKQHLGSFASREQAARAYDGAARAAFPGTEALNFP
jgi:hypothetical protein